MPWDDMPCGMLPVPEPNRDIFESLTYLAELCQGKWAPGCRGSHSGSREAFFLPWRCGLPGTWPWQTFLSVVAALTPVKSRLWRGEQRMPAVTAAARGQERSALARDGSQGGKTNHGAEEGEESANGDCPHQPGSKGSAFLPVCTRRETPGPGGARGPTTNLNSALSLGVSFGGECSNGGCLGLKVPPSGLPQFPR